MDNRPYSNEIYERFCREIEAETNFEIKHYKGRWFYEGPAIFVEDNDFQAVVRATTMPLQSDEMGKTGLVVYPR